MTPDPVLFLEASEVTHLMALRLLLGNVADVLFLRGPEITHELGWFLAPLEITPSIIVCRSATGTNIRA